MPERSDMNEAISGQSLPISRSHVLSLDESNYFFTTEEAKLIG